MVHIPKNYNISQDIDRYASDPYRMAIKWENEQGEEKQLTYEELRKKSNQFAHSLKRMGYKKGDVILVMLPRTVETYIVYLAALKLGMIICPGSELLRPNDLLYRIQHSRTKVVVSYHLLVDRIDDIRNEIPSVTQFISVGSVVSDWLDLDNLIENESTEFEAVATSSDDLAFLNYTSGTTGHPKAVMHAHKWALVHKEIAAKNWLGIQEGDMVWGTAAPGWGKWTWTPFISALATGATSFSYLGSFHPKKFLYLLQKYEINVFCSTPTEYRMITKLPHLDQYSLPALRSAVSAGEALNPQVIDIFRNQFGIEIRDGYGQTETTLVIANLIGMPAKHGSMGKATYENTVEIIDELGRIVPVGTVGHLGIHKDFPALFRGYLYDSERTSRSFRGDWYLTGDLGNKDEDGYYWYRGRSDDVIISSGYTIGPVEVENALDQHPAVQESAVVASPDPLRGSIVKAFVVLKDSNQATDKLVKELQDHVKTITAPYKYPREIEFVPDLPKTISMKTRRVELRQLEEERKSGKS
jgi:acetyl-CoA synthetase